MDRWIVVVGNDDISQEQRRICQMLRPPLHGLLDCEDDENRSAPACMQARYFPAFCNIDTNDCLYGLRRTTNEFNAIMK